MKIKKVIILLLVLFIPFFCYAKECNKNDIKIESIELSDIRGNAEELSSSNNNNNKINLNTKMNVIGDSLTYKVVVKNTSNSDYTFDKNMISKDYLSYDITYEDNSNIIKPNEEKVIYLRLSYDNKPEVEQLVNGVLKENDQISFNLTKETSFINPETGNKILLSLIYLLIPVVISFYLIKKKKPSFMLLLGLTIIPYIVNASCTCVTTLDINLSLEIDRKEAVFLPGKEVNIKMKQLAGNNIDSNVSSAPEDQNIIAIKESEIEPIESNKEEKNIVSIPESLYPIYMWYEDNTIYWWSEDETPALNEKATSMFCKLYSLSNIEGLQKMDSSDVVKMGTIFLDNPGISSLEKLENWNVSKVESLSGAFAFNNQTGRAGYSSHLTDINALRNWNVPNLTDMSMMFYGCTALTSVEALKDWDVSKVTTMSNLFRSCVSIEEIDLSNWETKSLKDMTNMFGMWDLTSNYRLDSKLRKIIISGKFDTSEVKNMSMLLANNTKIEDYSFLKYFDTKNVTNMRQLFQMNKSLDDLKFVRVWDTSNVTDMLSMFYGCTQLESLSGLEDWNTSNVTNMANMLGSASSLTNTNALKNWDTSNVTDMSYMFSHNTSLSSLEDLSNWNTSNVTNMSSMFSNMTNLEELDISGFNTKKVSSFNRMFENSTKLKHIYVGENWSTEANTGETKYVFPTTCELPNFSTSNPNYRYLSYAHAGEGGYLTLKTN